MYQLRFHFNYVVVCFVATLALQGCIEFDESQFNEADSQIRAMIESVDTASRRMTGGVDAFGGAISDLRRDMKEAAGELSLDAELMLRRLPPDLGSQPIIVSAYLETRIKANLKAFRQALNEAREEIQAAKVRRDRTGISKALDRLCEVRVPELPVATSFVPSLITVNWDDPDCTGFSLPNEFIEIRGWGLHQNGDVAVINASVTGSNREDRRPLEGCLISGTTNYLAQLDLETANFKPTDKNVLLMIGEQAYWLPIDHSVPEPPQPPPTPEVKTVTKRMHAIGDSAAARHAVEIQIPEGWTYVNHSVHVWTANPPVEAAIARSNGDWTIDEAVADDNRKVTLAGFARARRLFGKRCWIGGDLTVTMQREVN